MKPNSWLISLGVVVALGLGLALSVPAEVKKPESCIDKALCAEKIRYGMESYNRGKYSEAKAFFREAVQADPSSLRAWSLYDLTMMYDVAEQFKKAGRVVSSSAPTPGSIPQAAAPAAQTNQTAPAAPAAKQPAAPAAPAGVPVIPPDEGC